RNTPVACERWVASVPHTHLRLESESIAGAVEFFGHSYTTTDHGDVGILFEDCPNVDRPVLGNATVVVGEGDNLACAGRYADIASNRDAPSRCAQVAKPRIDEGRYSLLGPTAVALVNNEKLLVTTCSEQRVDAFGDLSGPVP